jgi:DNA (cytosine-5)-methyltransferase 1
MVEAVRVARPQYVIVENVADLIDGDLGVVLGDLAALGYDAEWHCIPACAVGAHHERDRIWIIAHAQRDGVQGWAAEAAEGPIFTGAEQLPRFLFPSIGDALSAARVWRADNGPPARMDVARNKAIGNAVVPQIPELIGNAILKAEGLK